MKNQKGFAVIEILVLVVVVSVIAGVGFFVTNNRNVTNNSDVTSEYDQLEDHINPNDAVEIITVNPADSQDNEKESIKEKTIKEAEVKEKPDEIKPQDKKEELPSCPVKGGPDKITFYPSDFTEFDTEYIGDVKVIKGGSENCGIMRLTVHDHYGIGAYISVNAKSGALSKAIKFTKGDSYRVCSEVRPNTSRAGYYHEFPENAARPFLIWPIKGGGGEFFVHCTEHIYTGFDSGLGRIREAVSLAIINNAFDSDATSATPIIGEEVQSVDVRRMTVEKL